MKTESLVSYIKRLAPDWSRADILEFIDEIQTMVFGTRSEMMRYLDSTTGQNPVLTTEDGVLEYTLDTSLFGADIQFVEHVYDKATSTTCYGKTYDDTLQFRTTKATPNSCAKVLFSKNPGVKNFEITCYRKPSPLLSESIQLEIPSEYHIPHVYKGVIGLIEMAEHGESNSYQRFLLELLPEMRGQMNWEGHNKVVYTQPQGY